MPTVKLPQVGKNGESATVRRWRKRDGERVAPGDILLEVETEAGVAEIESPAAGVLRHAVAEGKTIVPGTPLASVSDSGTEANPAMSDAKPISPTTSTASAPAKSGRPAPSGTVIPILMPQAGQSMEEGTLVKWRVAVGTAIKKGDIIFEIETDKATMEVEATASGRLARIVLNEGQTLKVLEPVAYLANLDMDVDAFLARGGAAPATSAAVASPPAASATADASASSSPAPAMAGDGSRIKASPAARKIAGERGIDLSSVAAGTGPGGRILSTDLPAAAVASATIPAAPVARPAPPPSVPAPAGATRKKMSSMRKAIARNLLASKQNIPHFYIRLTINAEPLFNFYQAEKAKYPCSLNDIVVLGLSRAIQEFPSLRSRIEGDELVTIAGSNIGVAVGMDDGLVVPVVVGAEGLTLKQLGAEIRRIAANAKTGKIEGMGQGVITVTNLGMFGVEEFSAIINPPEAAILAVGAVREDVIVSGGTLKAGRVMTMTLSADHRVVDGLLAAKFFVRLKELLEWPAQMVQ